MLLATSLGILVVPLFFVLFGRMDRSLARREKSQDAAATSSDTLESAP
jgi:hypothetical protein